MRSKAITRTLVSLAVAVGIAGGSLVAPGAGAAAPARSSTSAPGYETVVPLAIVNLGLSTRQAKNVQCFLRTFWGYRGAIDGLLGPQSWMAMQRLLRRHWGYGGAIDGIVGPGTISALQRLLRSWGYTGAIDGIAGPGTQAAFKNFANAVGAYC